MAPLSKKGDVIVYPPPRGDARVQSFLSHYRRNECEARRGGRDSGAGGAGGRHSRTDDRRLDLDVRVDSNHRLVGRERRELALVRFGADDVRRLLRLEREIVLLAGDVGDVHRRPRLDARQVRRCERRVERDASNLRHRLEIQLLLGRGRG